MTRLMGIVNVTPDSFSDGGRFASMDPAIAHGLKLWGDGADVIDVGGESTRPGATPVDAEEELRRTLPVVSALARVGVTVSIDTMKPEIAAAAIDAGATIWNDVNGFRAPGAMETAARLKCAVVVMHMQGAPETMQAAPSYIDVVADVIAFLKERVAALADAGVSDITVDLGIGFGKTLPQNMALMRALPRLREEIGRPVLVGASRKSFIGKIEARAGVAVSKEDARLGGSLAAAVFAAGLGADMLRVHDVAETVQALRVARALEGEA